MKGHGNFPLCNSHGTQSISVTFGRKRTERRFWGVSPSEAVESIKVLTLSIGSTGSSSHGLLERPEIARIYIHSRTIANDGWLHLLAAIKLVAFVPEKVQIAENLCFKEHDRQ
jgi:hypothetical protein